jgi:16S rRNA processing protein RimM
MTQPRAAAPSAAEPRAGFVAIGRVLGAWGVRGALKIEPLPDFPERFVAGAQLWLNGEPRHVQSSHAHRGNIVVELSGVDTRDLAASLRGRLLELPESELHPLAEDEYYQHELIGLCVRDSAGEELGRVTALLPTGANDVLVVQGARGEYLLPLIADVVQEVDLVAGRIVVELLKGLEPRPARRPSARAGRGRGV